MIYTVETKLEIRITWGNQDECTETLGYINQVDYPEDGTFIAQIRTNRRIDKLLNSTDGVVTYNVEPEPHVDQFDQKSYYGEADNKITIFSWYDAYHEKWGWSTASEKIGFDSEDFVEFDTREAAIDAANEWIGYRLDQIEEMRHCV